MGVRNKSRRCVCTRANSRRTGLWTAEIEATGLRRGAGRRAPLLCGPQDTRARRKVSRFQAALRAPFMQAREQLLARVELGSIEHFLQQPLEALAHRAARPDLERL